MPRVIHFDIPADNPARAVDFYKKVFGWKFDKWPGTTDYWLITTGRGEPGIDGGMLQRPHPSAGTVNTIGVASLDAVLEQVHGSGGKTVVPKMAIPGVGFFAMCQDTEGTTFGIMQFDEKAK